MNLCHHRRRIHVGVAATVAAMVSGLTPADAQNRSSNTYTLASETVSSGVSRAESDSYASTTSLGLSAPAVQGGETYEATSVFSGQLAIPVGFAVAGPAEVEETHNARFTPALGLDDGTFNALAGDPSDSFSINPVSQFVTINPVSGLVQATDVFENLWLTVNLQRGEVEVTRLFKVANSIPDNFGSYALDGIDDAWQTFYFGMDNLNAAPNQDPEKDGLNNLQEYLFRQNPNAGSAFAVEFGRRMDGTVVYSYSRNAEAVAYGARFEAQWSDSLLPLSWSNAGVSERVLSDDGEIQTVEIKVDGYSAIRRFIRVRATGIPEP